MSTQNTVWVVISSQAIVDKIRESLDNGQFSRVNELTSYLKGFNDKLQSMVQQYGGHLYVALYERIVLEIPITVANQIPNLVMELKSHVGPQVACGIGLDFSEAARASQNSVSTGNIEMYGESDEVEKDEPEMLELPPNLFNPEMQHTVNNIPEKAHEPIAEPVFRPGIQQELQMESQYLQAIGQSMGFGPPPQTQQQPGQPDQQTGQQGQNPQDLLEALHGAPIPGRQSSPENQDQSSEEKQPGKPTESEEESDDSHSKLAASLLEVRNRIPELTALAEKNPEAFKQSMRLIHKLVDLARTKKKSAKKSEIDTINQKLEELTKKLHLPVGTRRGRRVKVLINGKEVWRSMAAGRVQDASGEPISVKSHNAAVTSNKPTGQ